MRTCDAVLLLLAASVSTPAAESWTPELSMRFRKIDSVALSPDGARAAWTQTHAVMESEKSVNLTHIFLARSDGSGRIQLTRGEKSASSPAFSPDGHWIYFASERTGKPNLFRIRVDGGEAEQLTDWKGSIASFHPSPDGRTLAFAGRDEDKDAEKARKEKLDFKIVDSDPKHAAIFLVPLDGAFPAKLRPIVKGAFHAGDFDWSPDSRFIAFERRLTPSADDLWTGDIAEVEVGSGTILDLVATPANEFSPRYSPDGRRLAFVQSASTGAAAVESNRIALFDRAARTATQLPVTYNESPALVDWTADSSTVLFSELHGTRTGLYRMPVDGKPSAVLEPERGTFATIRADRTGARFAGVFQTPEDPVEVFVFGSDGRRTRVSAANTDIPKPPLGKTELIRWKGKDGWDIEGLLTYPAGWQPGKPAPLILNIHGGPAGAFLETFVGAASIYPLAAFAARGYAVLRPNPRGSSGYGLAFRRTIVEGWGADDFQDLMLGVDKVIAMGVGDPARLAVMGWSYGGYMTAWTVTQTTRFKAAVMGAAITDHVSMYGTQDIPRVYEEYFGGFPWSKPDVYARSSPINFVSRVKTPTLILHGEDDARVPPGQAREFYRALRRQGVETKLILYPRQPHGPVEPKFVLHVMQQHLDWVERFLK